MHYYSEIDSYAADWLENLMAAGLIPEGVVDRRDIRDVRPADLHGFIACHFFAGIGGWPLALRLAGWPDDRPVWTGSCPCQAHSSAARGRNVSPDLWPPFGQLIAARHPATLFGEQVAAARSWFDSVCNDLEALDYAIGAAVLPACSVGKDHARPRLYYVGHANGSGESELPIDAEVDRLSWRDRHPGEMAGANGISRGVGRLRAYGNAIVPDLAAAFIQAYDPSLVG